MKAIFNKLLVVAAVMLFSGSLLAELKVGYVDMQKALQQTKAGKQAKSSLEKEFKKKKKELEKIEADIKKMKEDLEKKSLVMSDEMKAKKQAEFQREFIKYQQLMARSQQEISMKEREVTLPILQKLKTVIDRIAEKDKYDMIFEKSEQSVLFAKTALDLTDKVVKEYEKK